MSNNTVKLSKVLALSGMKGIFFQDLQSVVKQTIEHKDCGAYIVFLDIKELWGVADLQNIGALRLLHQRLGGKEG